MRDLEQFLREEGVSGALLDEVARFREQYSTDDSFRERIPAPACFYYGKAVWEKAIAALLCGENLLLAGPKATGKNVLAGNLAHLFARPLWNVSFHVNVDAAYLIGSDTYDGTKVVFRPGPVYLCAKRGGFGVLDEINMARNEALAVLHAALDFRRVIDVAGYDKIDVSPAARLIGTMNYGYAGTRDLNEALCSRFAILDMPLIARNDLLRLLGDTFPDMKETMRLQFAELFYELERKAEEKWKKLIRYGIKRGEFREVNVDEIVNVILYSYQGARMWSRIISMKPKTFRSITDHIRKQLTGGER